MKNPKYYIISDNQPQVANTILGTLPSGEDVSVGCLLSHTSYAMQNVARWIQDLCFMHPGCIAENIEVIQEWWESANKTLNTVKACFEDQRMTPEQYFEEQAAAATSWEEYMGLISQLDQRYAEVQKQKNKDKQVDED